jgi:hypothetical protein
MKKLFFGLLFISKFLNGQIDSSVVYKKALILLIVDNFGYSGILDLERMRILLENTKFKYSFCAKSGFDDISFLTIYSTPFGTAITKNDSLNYMNFNWSLNGIHTIAYNRVSNKIYKIQGYRGNDICLFLYDYTDKWHFQRKKVYKKRKLFDEYRIPNVDMNCFYYNAKMCRKKRNLNCFDELKNLSSINYW